MRPRRSPASAAPALAVALGLAVLAGCRSDGVLGEVWAVPPPPSPDQLSTANHLDVHYVLAGPATVSARVEAPDGQRFPIHDAAQRPTRGEYVLQFDGTVAGPGPRERHVLPDGDYRVVLQVDAPGGPRQASVPLAIRGADTAPPEVRDLALVPDHISPNFDARDDLTRASFTVAKAARVQPFLDAPAPGGQADRVWLGDPRDLEAGAQSLIWDGLADGQPVHSGSYLFGIRAQDRAGNVVERSQPLAVEESGIPDAVIATARIGPPRITRGGQVCVDALVRNTGATTLRTQGPPPGYVYASGDSYASIEGHTLDEHAGFWRVGLNWSGSTDISKASYPYRWGFGHDLAPGEEVVVHGCVNVQNEQSQIVYFAALLQENVAVHSAGAGLVRIEVG